MMAPNSDWATLDIQVDFDDLQPGVLEIVKRLRPSWEESSTIIEVVKLLYTLNINDNGKCSNE